MTGGINWSEFKEGKTSFVNEKGSKIVREITKGVDSENNSVWTVKDSEYVRNKNKKLVPGNIYTNTYDANGHSINRTIEYDYDNDGTIDAKEKRVILNNSEGKYAGTFVQYDNNNDGIIDSQEIIKEHIENTETQATKQTHDTQSQKENKPIVTSEKKESAKKNEVQENHEEKTSKSAKNTNKRAIKRKTFENGGEQITVLNEAGKTESQKTVNKHGVVTEDTAYEYDKNGNCTHIHYDRLNRYESSSDDTYSSYYENGILKTEHHKGQVYYKNGTIKHKSQREIEKYENGNMKALESNVSAYDDDGNLNANSQYKIDYDNDGYIKSCSLDLTYEGENLKYKAVFSPKPNSTESDMGLDQYKSMSVISLEITITDKDGVKRTYNCNSREEILDNFNKFSDEKIWLVANGNRYIPQSSPAMDYTEVSVIKNTILQN